MTKTYAVMDTETGKLVSISTTPPDAPKSRIMSHFLFMKRLTQEERIAITLMEDTQPLIKDWVKMFTMAGEISLDDPDLVQGLYGLEAMGILAPGRAAEILI